MFVQLFLNIRSFPVCKYGIKYKILHTHTINHALSAPHHGQLCLSLRMNVIYGYLHYMHRTSPSKYCRVVYPNCKAIHSNRIGAQSCKQTQIIYNAALENIIVLCYMDRYMERSTMSASKRTRNDSSNCSDKMFVDHKSNRI